MWRSWAMIAGQPISVRVSIAACKRHSPDHVRRARLFAVGRIVPDDAVKLDEVDRAAADQEGVTVREGFARADQHSGAEGCIHLVAAPSDEVGLRGEGTVGRQLGGVDRDRDSPAVGGVDDLVDRRQPSGDVRSSGNGEQPWSWGAVQLSHDIGCGECSVGSAFDVTARGHA